MSQTTLQLEQRKSGGTHARAVRRAGKVPATIYGHGADPLSVSAEAKDFHELIRSGAGHHLMTVVIDGQHKDSVLLRSVQRDPVTHAILHADFQRVGSNEAIKASITLNLVGVAPGVKDSGGVLDLLLHQIEVQGPASELPEHLDFDISQLGINTVVHASEIALPKGFTLLNTPESVVLTIEASRTATSVDEAPQAAATTPA